MTSASRDGEAVQLVRGAEGEAAPAELPASRRIWFRCNFGHANCPEVHERKPEQECVRCGRLVAIRRRGFCQSCYRSADPGRAARHRASVKRYVARNREKRRRWVHNYLVRIGVRVPELADLRAALKALEEALAHPYDGHGVREPSPFSDDDVPER